MLLKRAPGHARRTRPYPRVVHVHGSMRADLGLAPRCTIIGSTFLHIRLGGVRSKARTAETAFPIGLCVGVCLMSSEPMYMCLMYRVYIRGC